MAGIGGIVENPDMYQDLSGLLNLKLSARLHGGISNERIRNVIELVGLQNRIQENVKRYSLGMKQRCGIAIAILHKPRLLILDEPTNGLDPTGIRDLRNLLKTFAHEEHMAIFVSSHMLAEMGQMCDRVAVIQNGHLLGVKFVQELTGMADGGTVYRFLCKPAEEATKLLQSSDFTGQIKNIADDHIDLVIGEDAVPQATKFLAVHDINIYGVMRLESSLEDAFMQMTGGGKPIA